MTICWGITSGAAGMQAQVKALAAALGGEVVMKTCSLKRPFVWLPNSLYAGIGRWLLQPPVLAKLTAAGSDVLTAPLPDLVISCGKRSVPFALSLIGSSTNNKTRFIHIQDPYINPHHFDHVVVMEHDRLAQIKNSRVMVIRYALHNITSALLTNAKEHFASLFSAYPTPRISVLIGGSTNKYNLTASRMMEMIEALQTLLKQNPGSLLITTSRRTGDDNIGMLKQVFAGNPRVYIFSGEGENPYQGLLAWADALLVTNDSVNMMTEAAATQKPLYILPLPGHSNTKPARFADRLLSDGIARHLPETGMLESWEYAIPNEAEKVAGMIMPNYLLSSSELDEWIPGSKAL